jgi:hypothetical protein
MEQTQTLKLLFARLGLPLPTVRWWTYWQIASLLDDDETAEATWNELLTRLTRAELEAEAVELLTPLLLLRRPVAKNAAEVRAAIGRPSVLSDHIVSVAYKDSMAVPAWLEAHCGRVPIGFAVSDEERERWGSRVKNGVVPWLTQRSKRIGEPLVEQFEYEMVMLNSRYKPHEGSREYFAGGYRHEKITGPVERQSDHLWRSAFLRTVAYAVSVLDMPPDLAVSFCDDLMPLSKWLGKMRPPGCVPTWLSRLEFRAEAPEESLNGFVSTLAKSINDETNCSDILGVLDARVVSTSRLEVEILAILVFADSEETIDIEQFFSNPGVSVSPDEGSAKEFVLVNPDGQPSRDQAFRTLTGKLSLGLDGYLQAEILMRPPWIPRPTENGEAIVCRTGEQSEILFSIGDKTMGRSVYWNHEWEPVRDARLGPSACTATLLSKEYLGSLGFTENSVPKILWSAIVLSRNEDYRDFSEKRFFGSLPLRA